MSSGHEARRDQQAEAQSHGAAGKTGAAGKPTSELPPDVLADIVAATAAQLSSPASTDPKVHAAMREVARQFAGQPMTAEPTGAALLAAILQHQFPLLKQRPRLLERTAVTVAQSLLDDPSARQRVEYLWAKLAEEIG
jgi:hypothetical protein